MRKGSITVALVVVLAIMAVGLYGQTAVKLPYTGPTKTLTLFEAGTDVEGMMKKLVNQEILKRLGNVKFNITALPIEDYDNKLALMYASGDLFDINGVRDPWAQSLAYGSTGVFLDYEKYKGIMPNFQAEVKKRPWFNYMLTPDNKRFALPGANYDKDFFMETWAYNKTLLDKYKIKVPQTSDEMMAAMKALKRADTNIYPFTYVWELKWLPDTIAGMFGPDWVSDIYYNQQRKEWYYPPSDSRSTLKQTLQYMNEMYKNQLFDPEIVTHNVEQYFAFAQKGMWAFTMMYVGQTVPGQMRKNVSDYEIAGMDCPKGPAGDSYMGITVAYDQRTGWGVMSNSKTKEPDLVCSILDWMWTPEATELINWGVKGVTFRTKADGTREYMPDFVTGLNPNGTKKLTDFGVQGPFIPFGYLSDVYSASMMSFNADSYALVHKAIDGLVAGRMKIAYNQLFPDITTEEGSKVASIMNPISTYVIENMVKFIMGTRSFDTWPQFQADIKKLGDIDWVLKLYNSKKTPTRPPRDYTTYWK